MHVYVYIYIFAQLDIEIMILYLWVYNLWDNIKVSNDNFTDVKVQHY